MSNTAKLLLVGLTLSGCSLVDSSSQSQHHETNITANQTLNDNLYREAQTDKYQLSAPANESEVNLNHFVKQMMHNMSENLQYINNQTPVAVSSFVYVDNYDKPGLLGNQLAESFMHELHMFGIPVIDFKTTSYMRVSPEGDFVLSRDYLELDQEQKFDYVLTGTMTKHHNGLLVNARITGVRSKAVVGTAQGFIPQDIVSNLKSASSTDGLPTKRY